MRPVSSTNVPVGLKLPLPGICFRAPSRNLLRREGPGAHLVFTVYRLLVRTHVNLSLSSRGRWLPICFWAGRERFRMPGSLQWLEGTMAMCLPALSPPFIFLVQVWGAAKLFSLRCQISRPDQECCPMMHLQKRMGIGVPITEERILVPCGLVAEFMVKLALNEEFRGGAMGRCLARGRTAPTHSSPEGQSTWHCNTHCRT